MRRLGRLVVLAAVVAVASAHVGSPDTVFRQIMACHAELGGFGNLIFIGRSGFLTHQEAEKSLRLLAREVLPRLREATGT